MGYKQIGYIQLGIFIAGILLLDLASLVAVVWALVDAIMIFTDKLTDSNGNKLI
ncbi:hypothetical protein [Clostridium nigeriense]|uniref:hypothetical protein n=1 Tax=Clostridium nigeriense TaxID=1805470 RepID=UPI000A960F6C|nr:hypothetical protein [Clostridium nigeriense]